MTRARSTESAYSWPATNWERPLLARWNGPCTSRANTLSGGEEGGSRNLDAFGRLVNLVFQPEIRFKSFS